MTDDLTTVRRNRLHLIAAWILTAAAVITFSWLTTASYVRQMLSPLPGEADTTMRECGTAASCAPDAAELVDQQLAYLQNTRILAYLSGWSLTILTTVILAVTTMLILLGRHERAVRYLDTAWRAQAGAALFLLLVTGTALAAGSRRLADIPDAARMFTFIKAFDSPYTDAGHLYFLAWLIAVGAVTAVVIRTLRKTLASR
ncbi:hypothetical protein AB0M36_20835 [Actinoplanes sp. NPDC051346]|uniref:hypothetical protein n=1 Tax=Actinoplanes sp. NPDC051346 TaxID=3155048 RepID=UPI00342E58AF